MNTNSYSHVNCPNCQHQVQVRALSMREMRNELLSLAGQPVPEDKVGNLSKQQLEAIYEWALVLAKKAGYVCPVPGE